MLSLCLWGGWEGQIFLGGGAGEKRADAHRGRVNALYFYFYREVGGGGGDDSWVWRVEIGSKGGGSAKILVILGIGRMPKIFYVDWELGKNGM